MANDKQLTSIQVLHQTLKNKCVWDSDKEDYVVTMSDVREAIELQDTVEKEQRINDVHLGLTLSREATGYHGLYEQAKLVIGAKYSTYGKEKNEYNRKPTPDNSDT